MPRSRVRLPGLLRERPRVSDGGTETVGAAGPTEPQLGCNPPCPISPISRQRRRRSSGVFARAWQYPFSFRPATYFPADFHFGRPWGRATPEGSPRHIWNKLDTKELGVVRSGVRLGALSSAGPWRALRERVTSWAGPWRRSWSGSRACVGQLVLARWRACIPHWSSSAAAGSTRAQKPVEDRPESRRLCWPLRREDRQELPKNFLRLKKFME